MVKNGRFCRDFSSVGTGRKVSELINQSGYTDKELAGLLHISVQAVNKWRHGKSIPDIENLVCLAQIFHVKIDDFLVYDRVSDEFFLKNAQVLSLECMRDGEMQRDSEMCRDTGDYSCTMYYMVG